MWNQDLYKRALSFAARAHGDQKMKGGDGFPYVVHVTSVAMEVLHAARDGALDTDLAMPCALLHDCIEDTDATREQVQAEFGAPVADGVLALSKNEALPKSEQMPDALRRIRTQPKEVWAVKLADRITNLDPPPPGWSLQKRRDYLVQAKQILDALRGASPPLERRLEQKMREYERYCTG